MIIKSVTLKNIRSYKNQRITFPTGSILLSGDIGSGKSTILLAIEFALFGIMRYNLSGSALLRHDCNDCSVELDFNTGGKDIIIKRCLRRIKDEVSQSEGYIIINGVKKNSSAIELKSEIFGLLGYPKELLMKGKDLVYRYTVYTPQEEMKHILTENIDTRIDILRKIFNIDKYKRIKENTANILLRELREKKRIMELMINDLDSKKQEIKEKKESIEKIESDIKELEKELAVLNDEITKNKSLKESYKQEIKIRDSILNDINLNDSKIKNKEETIKQNKNTINRIEQQIESLKNSIDDNLLNNSGEINNKIKEKEIEIENTDKKIIALTMDIGKLYAQKNNSDEIIKRISAFDKCPSCFQEVEQGYKSELISKESKTIKEISAEIGNLNSMLNNIKIANQKNKIILKELKHKAEEIRLIVIKSENIKERAREKGLLEALNIKYSEDIDKLNMTNKNLHEALNKFKAVEDNYNKINVVLEELNRKEKELAIKKARADNERTNILKQIKQIEVEIGQKERVKENLVFLNGLYIWVNELFLNLMDNIERHIMINIHREFEQILQKWFGFLIDDSAISLRIDEQFSPVIEQNGYDTTIENLSGGEKTAVALAYRLALNKVINGIISEINTKDLLILDEPTDGFSTEQLDKLRDVLNQIHVNQLIIVSHEPKIESFVDRVIRVHKDSHESSIVMD